MDDKLIKEHQTEKKESRDFKERRFENWKENYLLFRDKVTTNRLTQRQAINIPIMRETIQTWISKIDEPPELHFKARGRTNKHKTGELIIDEMWTYYFDKLKLDILDNVDKKIVGLQGRSFKICGISAGEFFIDILDPYDVEISPRANVLDLNSAQYVIRTNLFKPLREILANQKYSSEGKQTLKVYLDTKEGILRANEATDAYLEKMDRLRDLGAQNFDEYNATEMLVELNESYKLIWHPDENRFVRHLIIIAADKVILYNEPIKEALGISKIPIVTWADDPDLADIWCDGKGDSVRTINKVVNMYISQDVENRAYRNFGMYFFNTMNGTFQPRAFDPKPFGMYGIPGNPQEVLKQVDIPQLGDTTQQIQFLKDLIQSSVAQTPTERGMQTKSRTTLGEVEINLEQSQGRNSVSAKHYRRAWKEIGDLFYELMQANVPGTITLYKKGTNGDLYKKNVYPSEWVMPEGYECQIVMKSEKSALDQYALQEAQYVLANFQDNPVALTIAKRKQLETMNWDSDEIDQVMQFEENKGNMEMPEEEIEEPEGQFNGRPFNNSQVLQQATA
jgi:hypothetical protein